MKKFKKRWIIIPLILLIAGAVVFKLFLSPKANVDDMNAPQGSELMKTDLIKSIKISGVISSRNSCNISSKLQQGNVKEINVKVGDKVKAGQTLATLDAESARFEINQQRESLRSARVSAKMDLDSKEKNYKLMKEQIKTNTIPEVLTAEDALKNAQEDLEAKKDDYETNKEYYEFDGISLAELTKSEKEYNKSLDALEKAKRALKLARANAMDEYRVAGMTLNNARISYRSNSQELTLKKLEKGLEDSIVKSPIDGTVTSLNTTLGSTPTGTMFVVEDTKKLVINTRIKEYDAIKVKAGQKVIIKTDATGDKEIEGLVEDITPTTLKEGSSSEGGGSSYQQGGGGNASEFGIKIGIIKADPKIKIGMNARIEIMQKQKNNVFAVSFEQVTQNAEGEDIVYSFAMVNGKPVYKEIPVKCGMETESLIEISGDGLVEGMMLALDAMSARMTLEPEMQENMDMK